MKPNLEDLKRIEEAVKKAELKTIGEVVPIIYDKCSDTRFVFPFLTLFLWVFVRLVQEAFFPINYWDASAFWQVGLPFFLTALVAFLLSKVAFIQRLFLSKKTREKAVKNTAELEFYRCGIPLTQEKTGVLIFVSLMERYSVVLADKGISGKLPSNTWEEVLKLLNTKLSYQNLSAGFIPAIEKCSEILAEQFPRKPNDTDELPNYPILRWFDQ